MAEYMKLTAETIDFLSAKIADMYAKNRAGKKEMTRARLLLEETLIKYRNHFDEEIELSYSEYHIFGQSRFIVRVKAPSFDPFTLEENPMAFMIESVMSGFENGMPTWRYRNLVNEIVFTFQKKTKRSGIEKICISCVVAVAVSLLVKTFFGGQSLVDFAVSYVDPLTNAYAGLFCIMAVLLTFFAVTLSIVQIGDISAVGATGGRIVKRFYLIVTALVVVLSLPALPFFEYGQADGVSIATKSVYDLLIGFIPTNLVSPFLEFNSVHIMIVGAMFGFSLLVMGQKGNTLVQAFDECNMVAVTTNSFLNKFIYFYVALQIFSFIAKNDFQNLGGVGWLIAFVVISCLVLFIFYTLYVCLKNKIPFGTYFKAMMPTFLVCLSSANYGAAFSTMIDGIVELDAMDDASNLAISFGGVLFRPACTLSFFFSAIFMASFYGVEISAVWVVTAILLSLILAAASPNVPGVSVSVITLLFAQLGLPNAAVAMMIAIYTPLQFLTVAVDTWCLSAESVTISRKEKAAKQIDAQ